MRRLLFMLMVMAITGNIHLYAEYSFEDMMNYAHIENDLYYKLAEDLEDPVQLAISYHKSYDSRDTIIVPPTVESFPGNLAMVRPAVVDVVEANTFRTQKYIGLPETIKQIHSRAFGGSKIENIYLPKGINYIANYVFADCLQLKSVVLPDSLVWLGTHIFDNCPALREVTFPAMLQRLNGFTFIHTSDVEKITSFAPIPPVANNTDFGIVESIERWDDLVDSYYNLKSIDFDKCLLYVPEGSAELYRTAPGWSNFHNIIEIKDDFTTEIDMVENAYDAITVNGRNIDINYTAGDIITIYDISGKTVNTYNGDSNCQLHFPLDSGTYVVKSNSEAITVLIP